MNTALIEGVKAVGTGKKANKSCSPELAVQIADEVKRGECNPVTLAAFYSALYLKRPTSEESPLVDAIGPDHFETPQALVDRLTHGTPDWLRSQCIDLLLGKHLSFEEAYRVGQFLFEDTRGDETRGFIASILRMRHTEAEEYAGLLKAMHEVLESPFTEPIPAGAPVVQLAEPFDGLDRSYLLAPLIAEVFREKGYRVVHLTGRCSGPKYGVTVEAVARELGMAELKGNQDLTEPTPQFGWTAHQRDLSRAVDRWVEIRKQTIKRPFLATLEKYLNPWGAQIFVGSAFHSGFSEKMVETVEAAQIPAGIVVFKGIEGSLGCSLGRGTQVVCTARQTDGSYLRQEFDFRPEAFGFSPVSDPKLEPTVEETARHIRAFADTGTSGDSYFDQRCQYAQKVYSNALAWIEGHLSHPL